MELIIFRHGETDWNKEKKLQGHINIPLNDHGVSQAQELAKRVQDKGIEIIYSSDLSRAKKTAEIVAELSNVDIVYDARLREKTFGKADGLNHKQVVEKFGAESWEKFRDCSEDTWDFCFAGGETRRQCLNRVLDVLCEINEQKKFNKVGISTHGGIIRALMAHANILGMGTVKVANCQDYQVDFVKRDTIKFK
jgi:probable phosphoglycerate mutase